MHWMPEAENPWTGKTNKHHLSHSTIVVLVQAVILEVILEHSVQDWKFDSGYHDDSSHLFISWKLATGHCFLLTTRSWGFFVSSVFFLAAENGVLGETVDAFQTSSSYIKSSSWWKDGVEIFQDGRTCLHYTGMYRYFLVVHLSNCLTTTLSNWDFLGFYA